MSFSSTFVSFAARSFRSVEVRARDERDERSERS